MNTQLVAAMRSEDIGKGGARKLRSAGRLPAVVYGKAAASTPIHVDPDALELIFRTSQNRNTIVQLELDGKKMPCLVKAVQRHPLTRAIEHVDFYRLEKGQVVEVMVPVHTVGRPAGADEGGRVRLIRREVLVRCKFEDIPEAVEVDVAPMQVDDFVKISEVPAPKGCEFVFEQDVNVVTVYGKRIVTDLELGIEPAEEGGEGEGEGGEADGEEGGE